MTAPPRVPPVRPLTPDESARVAAGLATLTGLAHGARAAIELLYGAAWDAVAAVRDLHSALLLHDEAQARVSAWSDPYPRSRP